LNRYDYVLNNPTNLVDPNGYAPLCSDGDCNIQLRGENFHLFILYSDKQTGNNIRFDGDDRKDGEGFEINFTKYFEIGKGAGGKDPVLPFWKDQLVAGWHDYASTDTSKRHTKPKLEQDTEEVQDIWKGKGKECEDMLICLKGVATQINNWKILYTDLPLLLRM